MGQLDLRVQVLPEQLVILDQLDLLVQLVLMVQLDQQVRVLQVRLVIQDQLDLLV